jgi:dihydrodipicolinate synthase/N-acetylneuraminate lyase
VGVHTTQFTIRDVGLLKPVLQCAAEVLDAEADRPFIRVAGVCGGIEQAVTEAELAASLGYHAVLLSPGGVADLDDAGLVARAKAVGEVLPVIGFYLQEAVGGRYLSADFWRGLADLPSVVAVKLAPFDRYRTLEAIRGIAASDRGDQVAFYTGNDDAIIPDLITPITAGDSSRRAVGGLLGQWAVWTRSAVELLAEVKRAVGGDNDALRSLLDKSAQLTDANSAVFDTANNFRGCIAGVNDILRRQGIITSAACLDSEETLSPGQREEIDRVRAVYPWLTDDEFVAEHRDAWRA